MSFPLSVFVGEIRAFYHYFPSNVTRSVAGCSQLKRIHKEG